MRIIVIVIIATSWSDNNSFNSDRDFFNRSFLTETVYLLSEVECNFFAEPLPYTWWFHFQEGIFLLGPKSVSIFSCNTEQQTYLLNLFYVSCYLLEKKDFSPRWQILYFISNWMSPRFKLASYLPINSSVIMMGYLAS